MKRMTTFVMVTVAAFIVTVSARAGATKDECKAKCKEAAAIAKAKGPDAAVKAVMAKNSPFVWKDTYVFVIDVNGKTLAHPVKPKHVGKSLMHIKDFDGKLFFQEFVNLAKTKGKGWVKYRWPKPGQKKPSVKESYILKEGDLIFGAGTYTE